MTSSGQNSDIDETGQQKSFLSGISKAENQPLLSPRLMARLERLQLSTRKRLAGGLAAEHRSPRYGSSLDFSDYREYYPGDDLRRIDLNAYARLDRLLLKLYEAEDDLQIRILVDSSGSMAGAKLERAKELAAAIGFVALTNRDIVSLHTFPEMSASQRLLGKAAVPALFDRLNKLKAEGESPFAAAVLDLLSRPGLPGLTIVISDLLTQDWEEGLRRLPARNGDLAVVQVLEQADIKPDLSGDLQLIDAETGSTVDVSISSSVASDYEKLVQGWLDEVSGRVRNIGAGYSLVMTDDDLETSVLGSFMTAGVVQ